MKSRKSLSLKSNVSVAVLVLCRSGQQQQLQVERRGDGGRRVTENAVDGGGGGGGDIDRKTGSDTGIDAGAGGVPAPAADCVAPAADARSRGRHHLRAPPQVPRRQPLRYRSRPLGAPPAEQAPPPGTRFRPR